MRTAGSALFADFYEFAMLDAYQALGMAETAVFSLFVRKLPAGRNYLVACGQDDLLSAIESLRFDQGDRAYLAEVGTFSSAFLESLEAFRFTGDVHAVPEGTPIFANEPILEVVAPIGQGQLIETLVLNQVGFQTLIASKAARVVAAAAGCAVVDFGGRRAHGLDAAVKGARAAYVAGAAATSNVEAGQVYGIPVTGTVAHSFIQAFPSEIEAFRAFAARFPQTTLLVDTYDTLAGVEKVVALARELGPAFAVQAVRLDSGDLAALARDARLLLDAAGLTRVRILASGGLDEWKIAAMLDAGVPIDGFGVGTDMSVSSDAPALDIAYKLTEYAGRGRMKLSTGKRSLPGRKQVFRAMAGDAAAGDVIARHGECLEGRPLLQPVMAAGRRLVPSPTLDAIRGHAAAARAALPAHLSALVPADPPYPVVISPALAAYEAEIRHTIGAGSVD